MHIESRNPSRSWFPMCNASRDAVLIGCSRRDLSHPTGLPCWCASDNQRKGAATNAVQIAELLAKHKA